MKPYIINLIRLAQFARSTFNLAGIVSDKIAGKNFLLEQSKFKNSELQ